MHGRGSLGWTHSEGENADADGRTRARAGGQGRYHSAWADGGITGAMKIAVLAEAHGLDVEIHLGGLAHRHLMATPDDFAQFALHHRPRHPA
ncbi:MAG TPA: hypothetical protein EYQ18_01655 [Candidatus Handelsmanbacteria bacterium]|nr:hypothetical protein [Candidatus Handelsmanbacteria bacterium]